MYCYHCGLKIDEHKIEMDKSSIDVDTEINSQTVIQYICPRCGHLIHEGFSSEDEKELSVASHAQIQRGNNSFANGMCLNSIGLILLVISIIFFVLAHKPAKGRALVLNCPEFYISLALIIISVILLGFGIYQTIVGILKKRHYSKLLKDINNKTFVQ